MAGGSNQTKRRLQARASDFGRSCWLSEATPRNGRVLRPPARMEACFSAFYCGCCTALRAVSPSFGTYLHTCNNTCMAHILRSSGIFFSHLLPKVPSNHMRERINHKFANKHVECKSTEESILDTRHALRQSGHPGCMSVGSPAD